MNKIKFKMGYTTDDLKYSQIVTFCDGILRKRDDMIISFTYSQKPRRYDNFINLFSVFETIRERLILAI